MDVELREAVGSERVANTGVQVVGERRRPRRGRGHTGDVRNLLALQQVVPERRADGHSSMVASGYRGALTG